MDINNISLSKEDIKEATDYWCKILGVRHFMYHTHEEVKITMIRAYWDIKHKGKEELSKDLENLED